MKSTYSLSLFAALFVAVGVAAAQEVATVMELVRQSQDAAVQQDMETALALAHQATELDAAYSGAWKQLGSLLLQQQEAQQALEPLQTATTLDPNDTSILREWSRALWLTGQTQEALAPLRTAASLEPENTAVLREWSTALWKTGQTNAALKALYRACKVDPLQSKWWRDLAGWFQASGHYEKAIAAFQRALELNPTDANSWRDLGWTLWMLDRREEALSAMDKAIAGGLKNSRAFEVQVLAQLIEDKQVDRALASLSRWEPEAPLLDFAIALVRKGRLQAAGVLLTQAWEEKENPALTGLLLAYANAKTGNCKNLAEYLAPFMKSLTAETSPSQVSMVLYVLHKCTETLNTPDLAIALDDKLGEAYRQDTRLTDILERAAERMQYRKKRPEAMDLYQRVLARDADRRIWLSAYTLIRKQKGEVAAQRLLTDLQARATSVVVRAAMDGILADNKGQYEEAIGYFEDSLEADPDQPRLQQALFRDYLRVGQLEDAAEVAEWVELKVGEGQTLLRPYAAAMWMALGDPERALEWWQILRQTLPNVPYYAIEEATANYQLCRPSDAITILEEQIEAAPSSQAYELLAEIYQALDQYELAAETAQAGLEAAASPGLHRYHAESAEVADQISTGSLASAQALLKSDPGHGQGSLLTARKLQSLEMDEEAVAFYEDLLARNPSSFAALIALKNAASSERHFRKALTYAETIIEDRPWDVESRLRYAIALSENEQVRKSLDTLRLITKQIEPADVIPVLLYRHVSECPYPGRNNLDQLKEHLRRLQSEGYQLITPDQIQYPLTNAQAVVILEDVDQAALEAADQILKETGGRATYAGNQGILSRQIPRKPTPSQLKKLAQSGRWQIASSGPEKERREKISEDGLKGNPYTHPLYTKKRMETKRPFARRLNQAFKAAAASLPKKSDTLLIYPYGDYGQLSIDSDPFSQQIYEAVVDRHFDQAIFYDSNGFLAPDFDPLKIPARVVPSQWDADRLVEHLKYENPATQSQLELGKLLYWNRQHVSANYWLLKAVNSGTDPEVVYFNWGANALQQGDLPTALRHLRTAQALDPTSLKIANTLSNAVDRKRLTLELDGRYWEDNEGRTYEQVKLEAYGFVLDSLRLNGLGDYNHWNTDGVGDENGLRLGLGGLWYLDRQVWVSGEIWQLQMESDLPDLVGGKINLHFPTRLLGGYAELQFNRQEIETVEALRAEIYEENYELITYSRLLDKIDVYANGRYIDRTDDNRTWLAYGRAVYRLKEWPYMAGGYLFRFADSDFDPVEYWAPEELQQHQLYGQIRGMWHQLRYSLAGQVGYSREYQSDWVLIWGGNAQLDWAITRRFSLSGQANYQESETYDRTTASLGGKFRF